MSLQAWVFCVSANVERACLGYGEGAVGSLGYCSLVRKAVWGPSQRKPMLGWKSFCRAKSLWETRRGREILRKRSE